MNALSVPPPPTVTLRVAVAVRPAPSRTVSPSVCGPSATVVVVHANVAVAALPEAVKTWPPSTVSVNVIGAPDAPASLMPMLTVPLTVALAAGLVNAAVSVGVVPFRTVGNEVDDVVPARYSVPVAEALAAVMLVCASAKYVEYTRVLASELSSATKFDAALPNWADRAFFWGKSVDRVVPAT